MLLPAQHVNYWLVLERHTQMAAPGSPSTPDARSPSPSLLPRPRHKIFAIPDSPCICPHLGCVRWSWGAVWPMSHRLFLQNPSKLRLSRALDISQTAPSTRSPQRPRASASRSPRGCAGHRTSHGSRHRKAPGQSVGLRVGLRNQLASFPPLHL